MASLAMTLLTAEALLRVFGYVPPRYELPVRLLNRAGTLALDCYRVSPRGRLMLDLRAPATRARYQALRIQGLDTVAADHPYAIEYRYNSRGFRDAELGPRPPGVGRVRVLVLGDSFTEGQGVAEEDSYPRVLERHLNDAEPGRWEVRNCGRRGADFPELYQAFNSLLEAQPDLVIYGMVLNDPVKSREFLARQRYLDDWIMDRRRTLGATGPASPFEWRLVDFVSERVETWRVSHETTRWYREIYGDENRQGWERTQEYLRAMGRAMASRHGRLLVALWPLLVGTDGDYPFTGPTAEIGRACAAAGIPWVDLLAALRGRPAESLWVGVVDRHPNETAHRLAADALAPTVRALLADARLPSP